MWPDLPFLNEIFPKVLTVFNIGRNPDVHVQSPELGTVP